MAAPDLSVFDRIRTKADYDREEEMFQLKRAAVQQAKAGNLPAALQIADRLTQLRTSGDPNAQQQIQDVMMAQKMLRVDPGVYMDQGVAGEIPNYGNIVGGIEGAKAGAKEAATQQQQSIYEPPRKEEIARREADVELQTAGPIATAKQEGPLAAKKGRQATDAISIIDQAEQLLPSASGGLGGTMLSGAKGLAGMSDETTKANEQLKLYSGWLVSNVPRMEGPQSDFDVQNYQRMAADLGNTMKPIGDRLAALQGLRALQSKYTDGVQATNIPPKLDPRNIPMDAVRELKADPSGAAEFDAVFGEGAARMVLGGQ